MSILNAFNRRTVLVVVTIAAVSVSAFGVAVFVGIPDSTGVIHACYSNSNGSVRLVESAVNCKNSETAITWNQSGVAGPQGQQGPQGIQGPQGSAGPAGTSRAYASIFPGANPAFNGASGTLGWVSVTQEGANPGFYCLTAPASVSFSTTVLMLSEGGPGAGGFTGDEVIWDGFCAGSVNGALKYRVVTFRNGFTSGSVPFTAMLP